MVWPLCNQNYVPLNGRRTPLSIFYEGDDSLDFIAPNVTIFKFWVDELLHGSPREKRMPSKASEEDLETLLNMDLNSVVLVN